MNENPRFHRARSASAKRGCGFHEPDGIAPHRSEIPHFAWMVYDRDAAMGRARELRRPNQTVICGRGHALNVSPTATWSAPRRSDFRAEALEHVLCILTKRENTTGPQHFYLIREEFETSLPVVRIFAELASASLAVVLEAHEGVREEAAMRRHIGIGEKAQQISPRRTAQVLHPTLRRILQRFDIPEVVPQEHERPLRQVRQTPGVIPEAVSSREESGAGNSAPLVDCAHSGWVIPELPQSLNKEPNLMVMVEGVHQDRVRDWLLVGYTRYPPTLGRPNSPAWLVAVGMSIGCGCEIATYRVRSGYGSTDEGDSGGREGERRNTLRDRQGRGCGP